MKKSPEKPGGNVEEIAMFKVTETTLGACKAWELADTDAGTSALVVPEKGGMVASMKQGDEEFGWLRHPNFEQAERPRCGVPICFPVCGPTPEEGNEFGGRRYPMAAVHGFLHTVPWQTAGTSTEGGASVTVTVTDDEALRQSFPYAFRVSVTYTLAGNTLRFAQKYENLSGEEMPFSFGFHPYFSISEVSNLVWDITAESERDAATGALTPFTGVDFPYDPDQTTRHYAGVKSPMHFTDKGNGHDVTVRFDGHQTNAVLWQQGAERFVCMEPWNGYPGSLRGKHEVLAPGAALDAWFEIEWHK